MIALLDLGVGNLSSVQSGFKRAGAETALVQNRAAWDALTQTTAVTGVVLPGVGAFGDAMFQLRSSGLLEVVRRAAKQEIPLFGICLGMQLLFSVSEEHGSHVGLGLLPGRVTRFTGDVKIPHMGWNSLSYVAEHPLLRNVHREEYVYFVHSYYVVLQDPGHLLAAADYGGVQVPAVVGKNRIFGAQFHPEKSGSVGEQILRNFAALCEADRRGQSRAEEAVSHDR
ncbi:imidazole glycerol phosphate synthase subunit HisH [Alicyclobacillus cycloheptanicus]|uniref:Imidazole glycerol phosphate synthase subunit HisH n=1 Tax=Alicyclobacillus cycloheptanicus TaxID=1457 RepID=A0ABT9XJ27_9BACL|nr:imidazole glycerol phosphate synthase subunit HisH [Alicyclobacillus cycloheptanicus]MDQ0190039.1 glutamine amidotransferase [Alicyclobacillus cycloheptanicus]WDM00060.1 imidazole glycerol phosphate synthase subunit HisH [Alicyclobacillus cycloheptanicus]